MSWHGLVISIRYIRKDSLSTLEEMIKKLLKWFWRGNADESIEQKEYESMSGLVEEFGDEQEQEDIDIVFDNLQDNQEKSL
jgi:hypothetical protein